MPKTRPPYPPQLRARLIELARSGRWPEELGRQFEPSALDWFWLGPGDMRRAFIHWTDSGPSAAWVVP